MMAFPTRRSRSRPERRHCMCVSGNGRDPTYICSVIVPVVVALMTVLSGPSAAASLCATPEQAAKIRETYSGRPGMAPFEVGKSLGITEETVITGLPESQSVGTSDGQAFAKIWASLSDWERPIVVIPLSNDNIVEVFGPLGTNVVTSGSEVRIETNRIGLGGHFHPSSIAAIHAVMLPRRDGQTLHGAIFLDADGRSIISVYSLKSTTPAIIKFLSTDAYQRTRDLIVSLPPRCPK
jgi:putative heme iron utilization protein